MKIRGEQWIWVAVALATLLLRLLDLDLKPIHFDESINGWFVGQMWEEGFYRYDPTNFHGPLYFYFLQLCEALFGFGVTSLRLTSVFASLGLVVLFYLLRETAGRGALWAAAVVAVSPAFVFFGRTAIHEMTFVFFQAMVVYGWLEWRVRGLRRGVVWAFAGVTGCLLLKETFVIFLAVLVIAWYAATFYADEESRAYRPKKRELLFWSVASLCVLGLVYSGFFYDPQGIAHFFKAFAPWMKEGLKGAHEKPFFYYLQVMFRYEKIPLAALLCSPLVFSPLVSRLGRFFALLGLGNFLAYSLIPYKTPWLVLSFLWPLAFYAGEIIEWLSARCWRGRRIGFGLIGLPGLVWGMSLQKAWHLNWRAYDDDSENYVYVQTKQKDFGWLQNWLQGLQEKNPAVLNRRVEVFSDQAWPLPYIFRPWTDIRWNAEGTEKKIEAELIFGELRLQQRIRRNLAPGRYWQHDLDIRSGREKMTVFVRDRDEMMPLPDSPDWRLVEI